MQSVQLEGVTKNAPAIMNNAITASFINTITPAIFVESLVPLTKIAVVNNTTIIIAGKFIHIGTPKSVGTCILGSSATNFDTVNTSFD